MCIYIQRAQAWFVWYILGCCLVGVHYYGIGEIVEVEQEVDTGLRYMYVFYFLVKL